MKKLFFLLIFYNCCFVYSQTDEDIIKNYFKSTTTKHKLSNTDTDIVSISDANTLSNGVASVYYVNQLYNGIPIENATATLTLKNKQVVDAQVNFIDNSSLNINTVAANKISSNITEAVGVALQLKGYVNYKIDRIATTSNNQYQIFLFNNPSYPIHLDLVYSKQSHNHYDLVYNIELYDASFEKLFLVKIKATDLKILSDKLLTLYCSHIEHNHNLFNPLFKKNSFEENLKTNLYGNSSYLVYKSNLSGPIQGDRTLEINPYDSYASPFGWHDVDGKPGADYTITRGNNVYAYEDKNARNEPAYSPDGGSDLQFIFPFGGSAVNPISYVDASVTNLFYVTNKLHDIFYRFGFDENSGNFQENQYQRLSSSKYNTSDPLLAESQDGAGTNNANISVPRDGVSPRMQMYLWKPQNPENILVLNPSDIQGYYSSADNAFEPGHITLPTLPDAITAKVVVVKTVDNDDLGCSSIVNTSELQGNIALLSRGTCSFSEKVIYAQQAGAIAVIVMNNVANDNLVSMAGEAPNVTIPALFISKETGDLWKSVLEDNQDVILRLAIENDTRIFDASFDNSIITHEFGHGVTVRLTGGRDNINCLNSTEQMGEGWSDYFSLLFQIKPGDQGETPLGVGTYASGNSNLEEGIRQFPYSTDFSINPLTYGNTNDFFYEQDGVTKVNTHKVGTVWASILWDLTWKLINDYGFDPEFLDTSSGNYIALNLVMNALKLQPCNPSFITGRNAILKADELLYSGKYSCLIWEAFANRGVGFNASAGFNSEAEDIKDQVEDFTMPLNCSEPQSFIPTSPTIKVYPNPAQNDLIINIPRYTSKINIEIFDVHGRLVLNQKLDNFSIIARLKINQLTKGMYFIHIKGDSINYQSKIVKI